jgi:hypothetical protein
MNKVVREHYPASRLPAELREGIDPGQVVTVTVMVEEEKSQPVTFAELFAALEGHRSSHGDPVERVRALRDEWEERLEQLDRIRADMEASS